MYIKAAKLFFNVLREKLSPRPLAAESDNLEEVKDFAAKVYTTFFVQPKICNYYKMNKQNDVYFNFVTAAKLHFAACFRYAKCSFRVRLRKKLFNRSVGVKVAFFRQEFEKKKCFRVT
jgi:hypothetical protein